MCHEAAAQVAFGSAALVPNAMRISDESARGPTSVSLSGMRQTRRRAGDGKGRPMKTPAHDRCAFDQLGDGIVNLPKEERAKFTLAVVGPAVMWRLNDAS